MLKTTTAVLCDLRGDLRTEFSGESSALIPNHPKAPCKWRLKVCKWSESHSVMSDSLWHCMDCIVHGILQARILEWVAVPFSRGSSQPRDWIQVSCIGGGFFPGWATGKSLGKALLWYPTILRYPAYVCKVWHKSLAIRGLCTVLYSIPYKLGGCFFPFTCTVVVEQQQQNCWQQVEGLELGERT